MSDAHEPSDGDDEALVARLRAAASVADAAPGHVVEAARAAFGLRDLDAELASLVADSSDAAEPVGAGAEPALMRGADGPRSLSFEAGEVTIDVEVAGAEGHLRMVGLAVGAAPGELAVEYDDGRTVTTELDELGRFAVDVPAGRARLRVPTPRTPIVTPWTTL